VYCQPRSLTSEFKEYADILTAKSFGHLFSLGNVGDVALIYRLKRF